MPFMVESVDYSGRRGSVAVIVRGGRLLVIRRSQWVVAPGAFCFPGGGIQPDESDEEALVRELREELGVAVQPQRRLWTSISPRRVELAWWLARLDPDAEPVPNPAEVESVHWVTPEELARMPDLLETNRQFLQALASGEIELAL